MKTLILSLVLLLTISCTKSDDENDFETQTITPVLVGKGNLMGSENISNQNIIIYDNASWSKIINSIDQYRLQQSFTSTNVDFNNFQIIAVIDAVKNSGGHSIDITNIEETPNNIVVTIKHLLPGDETTVMSQPFHIVKIPKSTKPVVFQ
jgi:hypothetical protein